MYVEQVLGGEKNACLNILTDFFKHAFDGDGDDGVSLHDILMSNYYRSIHHLLPAIFDFVCYFMLMNKLWPFIFF